FLGLFGGWQFLDWLPFNMARSNSGSLPLMAGYPGFLIVIIFATLFMGWSPPQRANISTLTKKVGDTFFYNTASLIGMYGLALLFGVFVLQWLFPDLHKAFALLLPAGFVGGHGTATLIGGSLEKVAHWNEALTIGYTFATVGILAAVLGGILIINVAARRGWTRVVQSARDMPINLKKGFVPESERTSMGTETVNPLALDPLTWHIGLVMAAFTLAYYLAHYIENLMAGLLPGKYADKYDLPEFCLALLAGALIQKMLNMAKIGHYVDRRIMSRIGSAVSDYLIAFGIASIKITVVLEYAVPLMIMILLGLLYCLGLFWFVGRKIFRNFWFERGIFVYGWNTGVTGFAIMLLRVVDPKMKTPTLPDFGLAYLLVSIVEMATIIVLPLLVANGIIVVPAFILIISFIVCIVLSRYYVGWFPIATDALRDGETKIVRGPEGG
ncbi:MAG: hypothetical protein JSV03_04570, partial [Planctomycetota bacterium]